MSSERFPPNGPQNPAQVARIGNEVRDGYIDVVRDVTIAQDAVTTEIRSPLIRATTVPILVPTSSAGASLSWWLVSVEKGVITVGHAAPLADREFRVVLIG